MRASAGTAGSRPRTGHPRPRCLRRAWRS
jgi:hypothetical protein